jgi:3-oxoisoapionate kinase
VSARKNILLAYYGDDFTGSTDALEFLGRAGAKTVLFLDPPDETQLARYPRLDAFGVAGMTRSMSPAAMEKTLLPAFETLRRSGARHVHYKVCSTFDSSPATGSIGKAMETGAAVFKNKFIPLLVAAPVLGRYCLFGNLFARMGTAGEGTIYRLDRHPSMSHHPVTPAGESDLRLHLSGQTKLKTGLLDILDFSAGKETIHKKLSALLEQDCSVVLIDALYQEQLVDIGELMESVAGGHTLFSVGSSGIEMALGQYWNKTQTLTTVNKWVHPGKAAPMLVVSGSCSPVTTAQITQAVSNGFAECIVDMTDVMHEGHSFSTLSDTITGFMKEGKNVVVHSDGSNKKDNVPAKKLGMALGKIAGETAKRINYKRLVIAGGDTSSYAARALEIESVEMIAPIVPGAPLCKANAPGSPVDGMEINFKGGQVGDKNYFETVLNGG